MTTPIDMEKLKRLAEAATPGPWERDDDAVREKEGGCPVCFVTPHGNFNTVRRTRQTYSHADADYLAAASPDVVLALLAQVATLRAEMELRDAALAEERAHADALHAAMMGKSVSAKVVAAEAHAKRRGTR